MKFIYLFFLIVITPDIVCSQIKSDFYLDLISSYDNKSFPKTIVYDGPQLPFGIDNYQKLGFSYISAYSLKEPKKEPNSYKYILWTGVAYDNPTSNWAKQLNPFDNDMARFTSIWNNLFDYYNKLYSNPKDKSNFGMIILDIEAKKNSENLRKSPPLYKGRTKNINKAISDYKTAMANLYNFPLDFARTKHNKFNLWSSFEDVPIELNWWGIPNRSWQNWVSNPYLLNYITHDFSNNKLKETDFSKNLDFYSVSSYYIYNSLFSDNSWASQYLAFMLFQIESNMAWSNKPIFLYHTFKFQGEKERNTLISEDMVKNTLIFAFLSGLDGMVLYDDSRKPTNDHQYLNLIKTFIETISLLNKYKDYLEDEKVIYFKPDNPRDLFVERKTVIRGIEKKGKLLLAATNPFAKKQEVTNVKLNYKGKGINIKLIGKETYLKEITL